MNTKIVATTLSIAGMALGIYLSIFGFGIPGNQQDAASIESFFWPEQKSITAFEMVDHNGQAFVLDNFQGKWSFVFFGYTHCPDICPITMQIMRQVREKLAAQHPELTNHSEFVFVSVDGARDTPEHMKAYISYFGDFFTGATGTRDQIDSLTGQLGVPYSIDAHEPNDNDYLVGHSGAIFLISPTAQLASIYQPPLEPEAITERFLQITDFMGSRS